MQQLRINIFLLMAILFPALLHAEEITWLKDIDNAFKLAEKKKKTVMVMVEGKNCRWCVKMKKRTLANDEIEHKLESYITVKVMREDANAIKDLPRIHGVPSIFFMTAQKEVIESVVGYFNVEDFLSYISDVEKKKEKGK